MNSRTFNAWLAHWGYRWVGDESMVKGFMSQHEAEALLRDYESRGRVARG